jgi:hypothetical protein
VKPPGPGTKQGGGESGTTQNASGNSFVLVGWLGSGEASGHGSDHGDVDHRFVVLGQGLVVADAAAVFGDPSECSFHDPAAWEDDESFGVVAAFDDPHGEREDLQRPDDQAPGVAAVGPHQRYRGESCPQRDQQTMRAVAVLDISRGDDDREEQSEGVGGDVAFAAFGFLAPMPVPA